MGIQTSKKVRPTVDIQHDPLLARMIATRLLPLVVIILHLNPLPLEVLGWSTPLPPLTPSNPRDALGAQLLVDSLRR